MADEQIIRLLEEIRDLQKQHIANHQQAVMNQQHAIDIQKQAVERQKSAVRMVRFVLAAIVLLVASLYVLPSFNCAINRAFRPSGSTQPLRPTGR